MCLGRRSCIQMMALWRVGWQKADLASGRRVELDAPRPGVPSSPVSLWHFYTSMRSTPGETNWRRVGKQAQTGRKGQVNLICGAAGGAAVCGRAGRAVSCPRVPSGFPGTRAPPRRPCEQARPAASPPSPHISSRRNAVPRGTAAAEAPVTAAHPTRPDPVRGAAYTALFLLGWAA